MDGDTTVHDQWTNADLDSLLGPPLGHAPPGAGDVARHGLCARRAAGLGARRSRPTPRASTAGEVHVPVADGEIPAYRAMPATGKQFPVVLVVQEIFGVHEHIKDVCRRLAKPGYLRRRAGAVRAPGRRVEDQRLETDHGQGRGEGARRAGDVRPRRDRRLGREVEQGRQGRLAITGFCWGGRIVWLYAAHNPDLKAGVAWYGRLTGETTRAAAEVSRSTSSPTLKAPVLGLYGGKDQGIPLDRRRGRCARRSQGRRQAVRDRGLPGRGARLPGRLPAELSRGGRGGRLGAVPGVVPQARRRLNAQNFHSTPTDGTSGSQCRSSRSSTGVPSSFTAYSKSVQHGLRRSSALVASRVHGQASRGSASTRG